MHEQRERLVAELLLAVAFGTFCVGVVVIRLTEPAYQSLVLGDFVPPRMWVTPLAVAACFMGLRYSGVVARIQ